MWRTSPHCPDPQGAIERYRAHAAGYDASARHTMPLRLRAIRALGLRSGDTVLDVGCGTGLSFPLIEQAIGPGGRLIGVDVSSDMARLARDRVRRNGWTNVALIEATAEDAEFADAFDAILFNFTHDVLQSPAALANVFAAARPGARIAAAGSRLLPWWLAPANIYVRRINAPYLTTFAGLRQPWLGLREFVPNLAIERALCGAAFVASGRCRPSEN